MLGRGSQAERAKAAEQHAIEKGRTVIDWKGETERSLPTELNTITPEWLTLALRSRDSTLPEVRSADVQRVGEGFGLTGAIGRVRIEWESVDSACPDSLIVKLPLAQTGQPSLYRKRVQQGAPRIGPYFQRCAREVRFYDELAPLGLAPAPKCYFASSSEDQVAIVLLLEDFDGARQGDVLEGGSFQDVAAVLDATAPLHAKWLRGEPGNNDLPSWLPRWGGDPNHRHERYRTQVEPFLDRWGSSVPPEIVDLIRLMEPRYGAILRAIDELPLSVIHADLHLDNVLFAGNGERPRVAVLDWQSVCIGPVAIDLGTLITGSLSPSDRRHGLDDLLERYSDALRAHGGRDYPIDQLRNDVRLALLWRLGGTVGWLSNADVDQMIGRERDLVVAAFGDGRLANALVEMDARSMLMQF